MNLTSNVIQALNGRTLATAESCTGGLLGSALTAIAGSSKVYKGGVISYTNEIKESILGVDPQILSAYGAVSAEVARAMADGVRKAMHTDFAVSTTGLAGPGGDEFGNPVGTVYVGVASECDVFCEHFVFSGNREQVREQAVRAALELVSEIMQVNSI